MKPTTKKMIVTIINFVILIANAVLSQLNGSGVDGSTVATIGSAVAMGVSLV